MIEIIIINSVAGFLLLIYLVMALIAPIHNLLQHDNAVGWEWGDTFRWMHKEDYK